MAINCVEEPSRKDGKFRVDQEDFERRPWALVSPWEC